MITVADCLDCDNTSCIQCGKDVWALPYCIKQPVLDRYKKATVRIHSDRCKTCLHRLHHLPVANPCQRCIHAAEKKHAQ